MLFVLALLLGQTLAVSAASAHELDPGHAADECSVCLTVQSIDTPPVPEAAALHIMPTPASAEQPVEVSSAFISPAHAVPPARGPPL